MIALLLPADAFEVDAQLHGGAQEVVVAVLARGLGLAVGLGGEEFVAGALLVHLQAGDALGDGGVALRLVEGALGADARRLGEQDRPTRVGEAGNDGDLAGVRAVGRDREHGGFLLDSDGPDAKLRPGKGFFTA